MAELWKSFLDPVWLLIDFIYIGNNCVRTQLSVWAGPCIDFLLCSLTGQVVLLFNTKQDPHHHGTNGTNHPDPSVHLTWAKVINKNYWHSADSIKVHGFTFLFLFVLFFFYHPDLSVICRRVLTKNSANSATCSVLLYDIASNRSTNSKPSWAFFPSVVIKSKNRMRCWRKAPGKISSHQKRGLIYLFINLFIYFWLVCLWMVQRWLDYKDWDLTARWETLWDHLFYFYFSLSGSHLWDQDLESFS